ncbi:hypothetical protein BCR42DRAFT_338552 [Absidia repens]|uniref:Uncharacterized protein n=1 Tax=Absidia repens TaxID=90262 RepID=A0A1X2HXS6_9FUNG|nr:hypothetical protein BCR42DRAFT_338552 [Absidia repens]
MPLATSARPVYFNMNVYSRPNGKGMIQHIRHTIVEEDEPPSCFNLQSRHIGSVDLNDPFIKLTFYRSKDCLGASIHSMKTTCTHSSVKLMIKAKSVSIKRLKLVSVE